MTNLLLDHLWQSTCFALLVALIALLLKKNGANVRYWLWFAASMKFLVPFSVLTLAGSYIGSGTAQEPGFERLNQFVEMAMAPASARAGSGAAAAKASPAQDSALRSSSAALGPQSSAESPRSRIDSLLWLGGLIWLAGAGLVSLLWVTRWLRLRSLVADATELPGAGTLAMPIPVLETASSIEPGIAGVFKPVLLLPKGIVGRLSTPRLQAVLAHELEHWRRRDNLTASLQMVVEILFWFHPLVWWIGAQLVREREHACDESVLRSIGQPDDYAEGILDICQHYVAPPLRSAAISGGDLRLRIQKITANLTPETLSMGKKFLLAGLAVTLVAVPVLLGTARAAQDVGAAPVPEYATVESLYQAALREGEVSLMSIDSRDTTWMSAAFAVAYPGIRLRVANVVGHLPHVFADADSFRPGLDVVLTSQMEVHALENGGYLADTNWSLFNVPANRIGFNGRFAYTNNILYTVAYDERRVTAQAAPVAWRDLLDPSYRGLMATNEYLMPRILAGLGLSWGADEAEKYAHDLRNQDFLVQWGDVLPFFLNQNNPRRYFIGMVSTVTEQWESQAIPSGYVVPEPVIMEQQGTAVLATAPHPAAARLLAGWLASEQAKAIRQRAAQSADLLPDSSHPLALALRARNVPIVYDTAETVGERLRLAESLHPVFASNNNNPYRRMPQISIPFFRPLPQ
jgi:beta-lactamase regulating signal transducer with metallopeptidase domain/ABC-type Fe3+ transport system substrate-binding protein